MSEGLHVNRFRVTAKFIDGIVEWAVSFETDDGQKFRVPVRDGEEIPILLNILQNDEQVYFDPQEFKLSTGWNNPGEQVARAR